MATAENISHRLKDGSSRLDWATTGTYQKSLIVTGAHKSCFISFPNIEGVKDNDAGVSKMAMLHLICRQKNAPGKSKGPQLSSSQLRWILLLWCGGMVCIVVALNSRMLICICLYSGIFR